MIGGIYCGDTGPVILGYPEILVFRLRILTEESGAVFWERGSTMTEPEDKQPQFNRNILIAVDESDNARRAVSYVADLLGGVAGFRVTLLHVVPAPEEDYFPQNEEKERWLANYRGRIEKVLAEYRHLLTDAGFPDDHVEVRSPMRYCPSMSECILLESPETQYGTIVIGRQGLSRKEEFLFGSISSKIVHHARNCAVWIVE
jgi:nucleotide-binding universal stress UspA family protein